MIHDNDLVTAAQHFQHALELDPTDQRIISNAAVLLSSLGRWDEDIAIYRYLVTRDPVDPGYRNNLGIGYLYSGQWDEAIASYRTVLRLSPGYIRAHYRTASALLLKGEAEAALAEFELEVSETYKVKGLALAMYALGRMDTYQEQLLELVNRWGAERPLDVAQVYAWTDQPDEAFAWLDKANEAGIAAYILFDPWFGPLQQDPRWLPFLESIGNSPAQLDAIGFKVTLP